MRLPAAAAITVVLTACGPTTHTTPQPVPGIPLQAWMVSVREPRARDIYMRNDGHRDVILESVMLQNCRNVRQECARHTVDLLIPVGKTVRAMRLEPLNPRLAWEYTYSYHTRFVGDPAGDRGAGIGKRLVDPAEFVAVVPADTTDGACDTRKRDGPEGMTMLLMKFGSSPSTTRSVMVLIGADGSARQYTERRGDVRVSRKGETGARTIINVMPPNQVAMMSNEVAGRPTEQFYVMGPAVMTAATLGAPAAMIERVIRECGTK